MPYKPIPFVPYTTDADMIDYSNPNRHRCHMPLKFAGELREKADKWWADQGRATARGNQAEINRLYVAYHHEVCVHYTPEMDQEAEKINKARAAALRKRNRELAKEAAAAYAAGHPVGVTVTPGRKA